MAEQLIKKGLEGYKNVMPKSWIQAIKDKETGMTLAEILQGFNMYFLSYNGNKAETRNQVPPLLRKEGLWITYVLYDHTVVSEWYNSNKVDDNSWGSDENWRIASNALVGDISISSDGYWVIDGVKSPSKAQGDKGNTPLLRIYDNKLQVSYTEGKTYEYINDTPVYTKFKTEGNKLHMSTDLGNTWETVSDFIAAQFRWVQEGTSNNIGRIQISRDEGNSWNDLTPSFSNNLHISRYIGANETLPTTGVAEGTIYMKGPFYDETDANNDYPIYRMWVYAWKDNTLAWIDNGEFQSVVAGVVQETGDSELNVMSQAAVTRELTELESEIGFTKDVDVVSQEIDFRFFKGEKYSVTNNNDTSKTVSIVSTRGASDRNNVMDLTAYATKEFIAEIDATCFRCAQNGNFTIKKFAIKSDVETLKEDVETLKEDASMLYSDVADAKNDSFNQDKGEWKLRRTHLHPVESDVILEYLGMTECVITISGTPNNFILFGTNKATGSRMHLVEVTSDMAMPLVINNPRPDLELINLWMGGLSTTDIEKEYDVEITKANPFTKFNEKVTEIESDLETLNETLNERSDDAFILDNQGIAKVSKDIIVEPSETVVVLEYLGKRDCTFVLNGTPNNGIIVGTNKATGSPMHLAYVTSDTAFPLVVDNPRPDLELINIGFAGYSTATATPLNFTIEKQSYIHSDLDNIHNSIFNYDKSEDVVFEKSIVVKAGESVNILDYLGKVDCEFTIDGTPNNFIFQTTVEETGKTVELGRYTTEDGLPITFANPRYYQELTNLRIYGFSSALETELSITIRKKNAILSNLKNTPLVRFDFGHELKDMSGIVAMFNPSELNDTQQWRTMPNQLYDAFDGLVNQYPSYVSRVDIATELGLSYPSYASLNGVATSEYAATPTYKTYMYKLVCSEDSANGSEQTTKLKVLIVVGVHGNEIFAPMNAFHFAKALCESSEENYFKMRGAFDFYIIPCLNTYGMYHFGQNIIHDARCNANDVNLNRNFPVKNWAVSGEGTMDYTGASAGSEFETQLVMKALQSIQPNLYIDHHNYGAESQMQYFCTVNHRDYLRLNYQSYMDCNIAFVKGLPEYFGTSFNQVRASGLINTSPSTSGTTNRWCYENKMADFSATLEICNVIKYKNGEILSANVGEDLYGADALSVGEYTLRNIIMRFCQYVMEVLSNKNGYQLKS